MWLISGPPAIFMTSNVVANLFLNYLVPHIAHCGPFWTYWGVCQSAHNPPIWKIFNFFLHKIRIKRGSVLWKKFPTHVFRVPFWGPFGKIGGLPISPQWTDLKIFQQFPVQNPNWKGVSFLKKMPTLVVWAPYFGPFWTNWGVCQSAQNCPISQF